MTLSVEKSVLFARLAYEPHPGQRRVHESKAQRRVLACGARWGKSTVGAMEAIAALLEPRPSLGWIAAPSYDLSERVFRIVERVALEQLPHRVVAIERREHRIVLVNLAGTHSEVRAKSADRPADLLGEGLDWMIVDEAARIHRRVWETALSQRLIDKRGWALLLSTPAGSGWFRQAFKRGQNGRDPAYESWSAPSWENPRLDRATIEAERKRLGAEAFAQEYGGEFLGADLEPCDACGGPDAMAPGSVVLRTGEVLTLCPDCELPVQRDGRTLALRLADGRPGWKVIHLERGAAWGAGDERAEVAPPGARISETMLRPPERRAASG